MNDYKTLLVDPSKYNDKKALNYTFIPYYNGQIDYDPATGNPKENSEVKVHIHPETKQPIYTKEDLTKTSIEQVIQDKKYVELEQVGKTKNMSWGLSNKEAVTLYRVKNTNDFMVFTDATAKMPKPYADNSYSFGLKEISNHPDAAKKQHQGD